MNDTKTTIVIKITPASETACEHHDITGYGKRASIHQIMNAAFILIAANSELLQDLTPEQSLYWRGKMGELINELHANLP